MYYCKDDDICLISRINFDNADERCLTTPACGAQCRRNPINTTFKPIIDFFLNLNPIVLHPQSSKCRIIHTCIRKYPFICTRFNVVIVYTHKINIKGMDQKYTFRKEFSRIFTCIHWQGELLNPLIELFYCDIFTIAPNIEMRIRHIDPDVHADLWYKIGIDRPRNAWAMSAWTRRTSFAPTQGLHISGYVQSKCTYTAIHIFFLYACKIWIIATGQLRVYVTFFSHIFHIHILLGQQQ